MEIKLLYQVKDVHELNRMADDMKRLNQIDKLKNLAKEYKVLDIDVNDYLTGKRYFLIDAGDTRKSYRTARAKILDEMLSLKDPRFVDAVGTFLLDSCGDPDLETQILLEHKTLQRCISYLMKRAYDTVDEAQKSARRPMGVACHSDEVFQWVRDYYALDDRKDLDEEKLKAETSFKNKQVPPKSASTAKKTTKRAARKDKGQADASSKDKTQKTVSSTRKKQLEGQASLFDLVSEEENA